jgi:tetratricopeptide (TPR) repeat protein
LALSIAPDRRILLALTHHVRRDFGFATLSNLVASYIQGGRYEMAKKTYKTASAMLSKPGIAPELQAKLHFRGGSVYATLGEEAAAVEALQLAHALQPQDALIGRRLDQARAVVAEKKQAEKRRYQKMFG